MMQKRFIRSDVLPALRCLQLGLLSLVLAACASGTLPAPAGVEDGPYPLGFTMGSSPAEGYPGATAAQVPPHTSPPTRTPTGASFTGTPAPIPTRTASVTPPPQPTPDLIGTPGFELEGPGIVYHSTDLTLSNFDGSRKNVFAFVPRLAPWNTDFSPGAGRIVFEWGNSLWVLDLGKGSQEIFSSDRFIESPVISRDGGKIAYSLVHGFDAEGLQQLWTIDPDGSGNTLLVDDTGQYIADPGPFRLVPVAWSLDKSKIYLTTTTDSEATPLGMYVAGVPAGTIEKALTPQVTLWDVSFSPDRTMIAYRTFQWVPVEGSMPEVGPPFTLQMTELATGETTVLQESDAFEYFHPVWSPDGNHIAYSVRSRPPGGEVGLFAFDLATGAAIRLVPGSEGRQLRPWAWLGADWLAYTEEVLAPGDTSNAPITLYTIKMDGSEKHEIDATASMTVLGVLDD